MLRGRPDTNLRSPPMKSLLHRSITPPLLNRAVSAPMLAVSKQWRRSVVHVDEETPSRASSPTHGEMHTLLTRVSRLHHSISSSERSCSRSPSSLPRELSTRGGGFRMLECKKAHRGGDSPAQSGKIAKPTQASSSIVGTAPLGFPQLGSRNRSPVYRASVAGADKDEPRNEPLRNCNRRRVSLGSLDCGTSQAATQELPSESLQSSRGHAWSLPQCTHAVQTSAMTWGADREPNMPDTPPWRSQVDAPHVDGNIDLATPERPDRPLRKLLDLRTSPDFLEYQMTCFDAAHDASKGCLDARRGRGQTKTVRASGNNHLRNTSIPRTTPIVATTVRRLVHPAFAKVQQPLCRSSDGKSLGDDWVNQVSNSSSATHGIEHMHQGELPDCLLELKLEYKKGLQVASGGPLVLNIRGAPENMMAALSLTLYELGLECFPGPVVINVGRDSAYARTLAGAVLQTWREWHDAAHALVHERPFLEHLRPHGASFAWLSESDSAVSRLERLAVACATLRFAFAMRSISDLPRHTRLLSWLRHNVRHVEQVPPELQMSTTNGDVLEVAVAKVQGGGARVAVVICASPSVPGGEFLTGGFHDNEEDICTRTTLYLSLQHAARMAATERLCNAAGQRVHIPEDGVVLSPGVEVFRNGRNRCYSPLDSPVRLAAIISTSMPNHHDLPSGSAFLPAHKRLLEQKFEMVLHAANLVKADVLVISDVGCSVELGNDPVLVGRTFGRALLTSSVQRPGSRSVFQVVLAGGSPFQTAVKRVVHEGQECKVPELRSTSEPRRNNSN